MIMILNIHQKKARHFINTNNIKTIDFPSYSPDLNPIENVWSILKRNIEKKHGIKTINHKLIIDEWNNIKIETINEIISTMPTRLDKIILNKGEYIDY